MIKLLSIILLSLPSFLTAEYLNLSVEAEAALLMNADNGAILFEKNIHQTYFPASITKIGTASYILNRTSKRLDELATVSQDAVGWVSEEAKQKVDYSLPAYWLVPGGTHMGLAKGEKLSLKDLMYGLILVSANDAANVLAEHIGGTIPDFMEGYNQYAKEIGCRHTTFSNPHGLHHPNHQTTAFDMALLTREAVKNPTFHEIFGTVKYLRNKGEKQVPLVQNHPLLKPGKFYYDKAIGAKTGFTSLAQHNLVAVAEYKGRTLIAVLLKTKERNQLFQDVVKLFETAFQQGKVERVLLSQGIQKFTHQYPWGSSPLQVYLTEDLKEEYYPAEEPKFTCSVTWQSWPSPIHKNQEVGYLTIKNERDLTEKKRVMLAAHDLSSDWFFWIQQMIGPYVSKNTAKKTGFLIGLIIVGTFFFRFSRRR